MRTVNEFHVFLPGFFLCQTKHSYASRQCFIKVTASKNQINQSDFCSLEQEVSSLLSYLLPTHKKNIILTLLIHNIPHLYWINTLSLSCSICHRVDNYELVKRLGFFCLLIFPVSSPPSTNTLRFPHSSWMNTILSKSSKFPVSSISIPSSSSLTIIFFLKGCAIQLKRDCLWK